MTFFSVTCKLWSLIKSKLGFFRNVTATFCNNITGNTKIKSKQQYILQKYFLKICQMNLKWILSQSWRLILGYKNCQMKCWSIFWLWFLHIKICIVQLKFADNGDIVFIKLCINENQILPRLWIKWNYYGPNPSVIMIRKSL